MSRIAGRNGRVYLGIASSSASAEPLPFVAQWALNATNNKIDVTAMGDSGQTFLGGLNAQSGSFSGFYDDATNQSYTAAVDGQARKFYLYPSTNTTSQYWFGTVIVDATFDAAVDGAVTMSADWAAASTVAKVG